MAGRDKILTKKEGGHSEEKNAFTLISIMLKHDVSMCVAIFCSLSLWLIATVL